jgi:two-component system, OmpR family, response regulator QseB
VSTSKEVNVKGTVVRVLLVEDDVMLGKAVQSGLRLEGYGVDWVRDGSSALAALAAHEYGAVLLDLGLPRHDGMEVLARMRARGHATPVLIVTARDAVEDRIAGLDAGADDYVLKPFDLYELSARLRSVVRRANGRAHRSLTVGAVTLDTVAQRCTLGAQAVELTAREYRLVEYLMERAGRIVAKAELEQALFEWEREVESNVIEVFVSQVRRKLGREFIVTRRGLGYAVDAALQAAPENIP